MIVAPSMTAIPSAHALARSREAVSKSMAIHGRGTAVLSAKSVGGQCTRASRFSYLSASSPVPLIPSTHPRRSRPAARTRDGWTCEAVSPVVW
jgi:hypothetical protein